MPEQSLRFAVSDGAGLRSSTWKLWAPVGLENNNVYLVCRSLGSALKVSFHESGSWHVGFLRNFVEAELPSNAPAHDNPYLAIWSRPPASPEGVTLAFRVIVPASAVTVPVSGREPSTINWVSSAPPGMAVEFAIAFAPHSESKDSWPGRSGASLELVGRLSLDRGEDVWLLHHQVDDDSGVGPNDGIGQTFWRKGLDPEEVDVARVILFAAAGDGSRLAIERAATV